MWKDIEGYEGLYQVSDKGEVRSLDRVERSKGDSVRVRKGRVKKLNINQDGYYKVTLWKDNRSKTFVVHRLVANAFIPNPNNLPVVNHKDGEKTNNNVSNLEWCTVQENALHATHIIKTNDWVKGVEMTKIKTCILDTNTGEVKVFDSRKECEDYYGCEFRSIVGSRQCKRFKHLRLVGDANEPYKFTNQ